MQFGPPLLRAGTLSPIMAAMPAPKKTLYEILGVPRDANSIDLGLAFEQRTRELQRAVPPDPSAEALLHEAFEVLNNPQRRAAYDASLLTAAERAAAAQQAAPDLVLEGGEGEPARRFPWLAIAAFGVVVIVVLYFALRPDRLPDPETTKASQEAQAPKPVPPPPPKVLGAAEILKLATTSGGQVVSVEMSGRSEPIGLAIAVEPRTMVTTCHGIQAGRKLVVLVGKDTAAADLAITDEKLGLCRLSVPGLEAAPVPLSTDEPRPGDRIFVVGANARGEFALTEGTVRQLVITPAGRALDLSVPIAATATGGGVFDAQGRLVAIASTPHKAGPKVNLALPVSWLAELRSRGATQ